MSVAPTHTITELAAEFDVTPRAIRFYEDMGLLTPQRAGRNRIYTQRDRTRLKLTLRGKRLGLSLSEIKQLVDMYDSPSDTAQQLGAFMAVLAEHRRQLEQQREDIAVTLVEIDQHESRCHALLAQAGAAGSGKAATPRTADRPSPRSLPSLRSLPRAQEARATTTGDRPHEQPARPEFHARRRHRRTA